MEKNFDRYGNGYALLQLNFSDAVASNSVSTQNFKLFFENGSGMENLNDPLHLARRRILQTLIADVEKFLILPKSSQTVNLWICDMQNVSRFAGSNMSIGSSFYNVAKLTRGSIVDGEVFKSLLAGQNSYQNVVNVPNKFYHGFMAFNFRSINGNPIAWHTNLRSAPNTASFDLYSAMLKEFAHLLGFCSLINANGTSVFGVWYEYFSRYDKFLQNENNTQPLLTSKNSNGIYDYVFNKRLLPQILRPNCILVNNTSYINTDNSDCETALWYSSTGVQARIYTPLCFENGYSFSCLEDQLYPSCDESYGNNLYFATSNSLSAGTSKRFLQAEERIVLTDIGYKLATTYGSVSTKDGFQTYSSSADALAMQVIGINDGINQDLSFRFVGNVGQGISISGSSLLENDFQANSFVGLQCLTAGGSVNTTTGNFGSSIFFNSTTGGLFLLRYIPSNDFQSGNITYFYVYMNANNDCGTPTACQNVVNGFFESYVQLPRFPHQIELACNWKNYAGGGMQPANYNHANSTAWQVGVPNNAFGSQSDNVVGNKAYATLGSYYWPNFPNFPPGVQQSNTISQIIKTKLSSPMIAGKKYKISYQVSKGDNAIDNISIVLQAFITAVNFPPTMLNFLSDAQVAQGSLYTNSNANGTPNFVTNTTAWTTISFDHTAIGNEEFLYLGALYNAPVQNPPTVGGASFMAWYYYDNVSISIVEEAISDTFALVSAPTQFVTATSVLNNDTYNGIAPNLTIVQTPNLHPYLTINTNGTVTVAANIPVGSYVINYRIASTCGISNVSTVTVVVQNITITANGKCTEPTICSQNSIQITDTPLSPNSTWSEGLYPAYYINGVPALMGQVQWFPVGTITPSCLTLNPNGSITVQPNCTLGSPSISYQFYMKACDTTNPTNCTAPIRVNGLIGAPIEAPNYDIYLTQTGAWLQTYNGQYSGHLNVMGQVRFCGENGGISQVLVTQNRTNPYWFLNLLTGEIENSNNIYPLGISVVSYTICQIGNPNNCATGAVMIHIVN